MTGTVVVGELLELGDDKTLEIPDGPGTAGGEYSGPKGGGGTLRLLVGVCIGWLVGGDFPCSLLT